MSERVRPSPMSAAVSRQMSRMPRRNSKPELLIRRELHARGLRFRLNSRLPGRPDILFTRARLAIFVDGCFWHRCPDHGTTPKNNRDWWVEKLEQNVRRDRRKDEELEGMGWSTLHVWEHESVAAAADRIEVVWRERILPVSGRPT